MLLGESALDLRRLCALARTPTEIGFSDSAMTRMKRGRETVDRLAVAEKATYGVNTGFGALAEVRIEPARLKELQRRLLLSHAAGVGAPMSASETRALLLLRILVLQTGTAGVRPLIAERMLDLYRLDILPIVPEKGSVGASGDLAPLAHLALAIIGEGEVMHKGVRKSAKDALASAGLQPIELAAKEGLALVNGTQAMSAVGGLAVDDALQLCEWADAIGAMSLEGMLGSHTPFDARISRVRPHPGQVRVAGHMRAILQDSALHQSHANCAKVQDAYSFRCIPQVHGASRDALGYAERVLSIELNAATDNPLVFYEEGDVVSGGNFHGQPLALALDFAAMATAEIANISERRVEQLLNPNLSGLPAFLSSAPGENSGYMMAQVTQASLINENKVLCHPASVDSIPGSASREDHVSMGMTSARKLREVVKNTRTVLAIELMAAAQALDLRRPLRSSGPIEALHEKFRRVVPKLEDDRYIHPDIEAAIAFVSGPLPI